PRGRPERLSFRDKVDRSLSTPPVVSPRRQSGQRRVVRRTVWYRLRLPAAQAAANLGRAGLAASDRIPMRQSAVRSVSDQSLAGSPAVHLMAASRTIPGPG